jgi:hypothetical protein
MPTEAITKDAQHLQLQLLDDEFYTRFPENKKYKGPPSDELDHAWSGLIEGMNFRIPKELAKQTGFESIQLGDGTGDYWGTLTVSHNLHCLVRSCLNPNPYIHGVFSRAKLLLTCFSPFNQKKIRESFWPDRYPDTYNMMRVLDDGKLHPHADHCIDKSVASLLSWSTRDVVLTALQSPSSAYVQCRHDYLSLLLEGFSKKAEADSHDTACVCQLE